MKSLREIENQTNKAEDAWWEAEEVEVVVANSEIDQMVYLREEKIDSKEVEEETEVLKDSIW